MGGRKPTSKIGARAEAAPAPGQPGGGEVAVGVMTFADIDPVAWMLANEFPLYLARRSDAADGHVEFLFRRSDEAVAKMEDFYQPVTGEARIAEKYFAQQLFLRRRDGPLADGSEGYSTDRLDVAAWLRLVNVPYVGRRQTGSGWEYVFENGPALGSLIDAFHRPDRPDAVVVRRISEEQFKVRQMKKAFRGNDGGV